MSRINIIYGNTPVAESGYQNVRWQVNNNDPFNPEVSAEVPLASNTLAGVLKITGDIGGVWNDLTVVGIQGQPVNATAPTTGQFLAFISGAWKPKTLVASDITNLTSYLSGTYQALSQKDTAGGYAGLDGSGLVPLTEIPNLPASIITSGQLALAGGGTGVDLSSSGGSGFVLKQNASHVISAAALVAGDIPDISGTYLTVTTAASTYETQSAAASTYLTITGAASTYLTQTSAASTYLTITSAASTYAPLASPVLTGTPKAPTATSGTNTTQIATTAFVQAALSGFSGTLAGDSDVSISSPSDGDVLTYDAGSSRWKNKPDTDSGGGGGGGGSSSRTTATVTGSSLAPGATATGTVTMAKTFGLLQCVGSAAIRLRLYSSTSFRDADLTRAPSIFLDDSVNHGCICDLVLNASTGLTWVLNPTAYGTSAAASTSIAYSITNLSNTLQTVTATLTYLPEES